VRHSIKPSALACQQGQVTMINLPSTELLEQRHAFPCSYTFKVIGFADQNFTARVIASVRDELNLEQDPPFSIRSTAQGRHVSVTLEPHCESSRQVLAIYSRLSGLDGLVMLL
jgi:putative lipoic acid-binding regulatory protein